MNITTEQQEMIAEYAQLIQKSIDILSTLPQNNTIQGLEELYVGNGANAFFSRWNHMCQRIGQEEDRAHELRRRLKNYTDDEEAI